MSEAAMQNLKSDGAVVFINVPIGEIKRRVTNIKTRGIAFRRGETLDDVFESRMPLYKKYADITVEFSKGSIEKTVEKIVKSLNAFKL